MGESSLPNAVDLLGIYGRVSKFNYFKKSRISNNKYIYLLTDVY